jgi:hypothetical protein
MKDKFTELGAGQHQDLVNNLFVSDFFSAMRINVQATLDTLRSLHYDNAVALKRMLDFWVETRGGGGGPNKGPGRPPKSQNESRLQHWKRVTSGENYGDKTKTDKEVELLLERAKIYRDLATQCRSLLGVKRSVVASHPTITPQQAKNLNLVFYDDGLPMGVPPPRLARPKNDDDDDEEEEEGDEEPEEGENDADIATKLPALTWSSSLYHSIYLNLDWDDVRKTNLKWNTTETGFTQQKDGHQLPAVSNSWLLEWVGKARLRWLSQMRDALVDMDSSLVGMRQIKEQVGQFLLKQILYPAAPAVSGNYMNFLVGGNPGTGKTTLAQKFPLLLYLMGLLAGRPDPIPRLTARNDWIAEYEGQTAQKTRTGLLQQLGKLVIIDEFYALHNDARDTYGAEFLNQLVNDMTLYRGLLSVMGMGYLDRIRSNILKGNEGLERRFNYQWQIPNYNGSDLFNILLNKLVDLEYQLPGIERQTNNQQQKVIARSLTAVLSANRNKTTKDKWALMRRIPDFTGVTQRDAENYDSVHNILVGLQGTGIFDEINAAVISPLIADYNSTVTGVLLVDGGNNNNNEESSDDGASSVEEFDRRYRKLRLDDVKKFDLAILIKTLVRYGLQKGYLVQESQ